MQFFCTRQWSIADMEQWLHNYCKLCFWLSEVWQNPEIRWCIFINWTACLKGFVDILINQCSVMFLILHELLKKYGSVVVCNIYWTYICAFMYKLKTNYNKTYLKLTCLLQKQHSLNALTYSERFCVLRMWIKTLMTKLNSLRAIMSKGPWK